MDSLAKLGLSPWFKDQAKKLYNPEAHLARVTIVNRDQFIVRDASGEYPTVIQTKLLRAVKSAGDLPCVGDWVCVDPPHAKELAVISGILPRKTFLRRKSIKKAVDFQMIAVNVDTTFIVQSCHFDFNIERLERYLVMINEGRVTPVIILTKIDLITEGELTNLISDIRERGIKAPIIPLSNKTGEGISELHAEMTMGKTYCVVGSSGVGKTTLINNFLGSSLKTNEVSDSGEGRHTTVSRQLLVLKNHAMLIDTPGMRELGVFAKEEDVEESFTDIQELASQCKFSDCGHTSEPKCAIKAALEDGTLNERHYRNFFKLKKESYASKLSYADRKKKDKDLGKMIKGMKKSQKSKK